MKFEDMINNITLGDSYKLIKDIPDKSIDLVIIDPPYDIGSVKNNTSKMFVEKGINKMMDELENQDLVSGIDYSILDELVRIMKEINIYIWCNKNMIPEFIKYFVDKYKCNFNIISWHKTNAMPLLNGQYLIDTEYCLYFKKNKRLNTDYNSGKTHYELPINIKDKEKYKHPTIKPLQIIKNLIKNSSNEGDIVLDCFSGSGTTCVASKELNRRYIGIEINPEYHQISIDRLNGMLANGQISFDTDISKI